jgi:hypothetical protein
MEFVMGTIYVIAHLDGQVHIALHVLHLGRDHLVNIQIASEESQRTL